MDEKTLELQQLELRIQAALDSTRGYSLPKKKKSTVNPYNRDIIQNDSSFFSSWMGGWVL